MWVSAWLSPGPAGAWRPVYHLIVCAATLAHMLHTTCLDIVSLLSSPLGRPRLFLVVELLYYGLVALRAASAFCGPSKRCSAGTGTAWARARVAYVSQGRARHLVRASGILYCFLEYRVSSRENGVWDATCAGWLYYRHLTNPSKSNSWSSAHVVIAQLNNHLISTQV